MHENKFEKQVREKMDELGFDPSESVWAGVDKEINKGKKRRRPIICFFIFLGLFLVAGGYYFGSDNSNSGVRKTGRNQKSQDTLQGRPTVPVVEEISGEKAKNETAETSAGANTNKQRGQNTGSVSGQQLKRNGPEQNLTTGMKEVSRVENNRQEKGNHEKNETGISSFDSASATSPPVVAENKTAVKDSVPGIAENKTTVKDSVPGIAEDKTSVKDSVPGIAAAGAKKKENPLAWRVGFNGEIGFSNTYQSLFQSSYPANSAAYGGNSSGNPGTGSSNYTAYPVVRAGLSFAIGAFASRQLSKRISLSAGLGYHYYSTKINTGDFIDSSIAVSSPYLQSAVNAFYRNGQDRSYTNQYHFIELPVSANFQLNKNERLPVIWEAGFSLSYLVSSNALHYDPSANVYFQNNQLLNRTQFSLGTALLIGFHIHHDELQIGPQFQYGLTGLMKDGTGESRHLSYGGLKISYITGKK